MLTLILNVALVVIVLSAISLQKTYNMIPAKELKRRAREGDALAKLLHRAVAYNLSLRVLLWGVIGVSSGLLFVSLANSVATWLAIILAIVLVWFGFVWLPNGRTTVLGKFIAKIFTPVLVAVLERIHPFLERLGLVFQKHRPLRAHTGMYQKEDLLDLLHLQKKQTDSRMTEEELDIATHALTFGSKLVREVMIPRGVVKSVKATDSVGPVLMTELHDSGFSRFPVYEDKKDNIVGTLYLRDLVSARAGGQVKSAMHTDVYYVHEENTLYQVLQTFFKTKHHLYVVVNSFEEVVGIITIEDVLQQIVGKPMPDEFDKYDDLRAVAAKNAEQEHKTHDEVESN